MNEIKIFENKEFGKIQIIEENGKFEFEATGTAKILGYSNPNDAIQRHCRCLVKHDVPHPQSKDKTISKNFISEGDLYRLITHSKLPSAEKFEKWVFDEVLPSIRKNGGYIQNQENLSDSELMAKALLLADKQIKDRNKIIEEQKPKVLFADSVSASKNSILVGDLSKLIKQNGIDIGRDRLFEWLRNNGYLGKKGLDYNKPTQKSMDLKLFELKPYTKVSPNGSIITYFTPYVTGKGQIYFVNKFLGDENANI